MRTTKIPVWVDLLLIITFGFVGISALFHPGLYTAHDIWHQVARIYHYKAAVIDGQFPPYWVSNLASGYGYPLFMFSYHLPWLFALPLIFAGVDIPTTLKLLFILSYVFSGIFMYLLVKKITLDRLAAVLSAVLYLWAPYHFFAVLVAASIGTVFVFTFLPLFLLGLIKLVNKQFASGLLISSISLFALILSHFMSLIFLLPLIIFYIIWLITDKGRSPGCFWKISLAITLGILLSAFYLVPAAYYQKDTRFRLERGITQLYERNFPNVNQFIYSKWGYSPITTNAKDGEISFQIGIAQWLSLLGLVFILFKKRIVSKISFFAVASFFVSIFLMTDYSKLLWDFGMKFVSLDYPTRFMLPATFVGSLFSGLLIYLVKDKGIRYVVAVLLITVALYTNKNHINVNKYTDLPIKLYVDSEFTTNTFNEYLPKVADFDLVKYREVTPENEFVKVLNTLPNSRQILYELEATKEASFSAHQFYFPGQISYLDGKKVDARVDKKGRINLDIEPGRHSLKIQFEKTEVIIFSQLLSLLGVGLLIYLCYRYKEA